MASPLALLAISVALVIVPVALADCDEITLDIKQTNGTTDLLIDASFPTTDFAGTTITIVFNSQPGSEVTSWGVNDVSFTSNRVTMDVAGMHKGRFGVLLNKPTTDALTVVRVSSDEDQCGTDAVRAPVWSWEGPNGPANWESIGYPDCGPSNEFQSPFNIETSSATSGQTVIESREHVDSTFSVSQSHGVPVFTCADPGTCGGITASGVDYDLVQFHFHSYSEYSVDGEVGILGVHFVHASADGQLLVLGRIYLTSNETNPGFEKFWTAETVSASADDEVTVDLNIDTDMYGDAVGTTLYEFQGSLTTPPCSGGVQWLFIGQPGTISQAQAEIYRSHAALTNNRGENRPLQPVNGRTITSTTL